MKVLPANKPANKYSSFIKGYIVKGYIQIYAVFARMVTQIGLYETLYHALRQKYSKVCLLVRLLLA